MNDRLLTDEEMKSVILNNLRLLDDVKAAPELLYTVAKAQDLKTREATLKEVDEIENWLEEARKYVYENDKFPLELKLFYLSLLTYSNHECWMEYKKDGYTPQEAIDEDITCLD